MNKKLKKKKVKNTFKKMKAIKTRKKKKSSNFVLSMGSHPTGSEDLPVIYVGVCRYMYDYVCICRYRYR
jgi:hypothetical protein